LSARWSTDVGGWQKQALAVTPARGKLNEMEEAPMKVTLTEPGLAADYIVVERNADGRCC